MHDSDIELFSLRAGSSFLSKGGVEFRLSKIIEHPQFESGSFDFDFALLKFSVEVIFRLKTRPIKLPKENERLKAGTRCVISGFGFTEDFHVSEVLQSAEVKIIDEKRCKLKYEKLGFLITDRMFCAGEDNSNKNENNKDSCSGDSVRLMISCC